MTLDMNQIQPLLIQLATALIVIALGAAIQALHTYAKSHASNQLGVWTDRMVRAAEQQFLGPDQGTAKKEWAISKLQALFPKVKFTILSAVVEGAVQAIQKDKG